MNGLLCPLNTGILNNSGGNKCYCYYWCVAYSELSRDARIHVELWDVSENMEPRFVGDSTVILFSKRGVYRRGITLLPINTELNKDVPLKTSVVFAFSSKDILKKKLKYIYCIWDGALKEPLQ